MPDVSFCRDIKPGARGDDVIAHKRAISRADPKAYPWHEFSEFYGEFFKDAVIKMFPNSKGIIGKVQHEALEKKKARNKDEPAFDSVAVNLARNFCAEFTRDHTRDHIVEAGFFWYAHRASIAYSQNRAAIMCKPPTVPRRWDCSMFVTNCHYAGGAPDPNRMNYTGYGYTGSLLATGTKKKSVDEILPGDAIMYGYTTHARPGFPVGSPTHVALYVGNHKVLSLGSYPVKYLAYDYRSINCFVHYDL
jgi:hypothetical protein